MGKVGHLHVKNRFVKEFAYHITSSTHHNNARTNTRCGRCPSVVWLWRHVVGRGIYLCHSRSNQGGRNFIRHVKHYLYLDVEIAIFGFFWVVVLCKILHVVRRRVLWLWRNCKQLLQVEMQRYYALYEYNWWESN